LRPTGEGEYPAREFDGKMRAAAPYIECDVWVFDRQGVTQTGTEVRISWRRAVAQLDGLFGELVACKPVEQDDRSVILVGLTGAAREVASKIVAEIEGGDHAPEQREYPPDEEPF
jgi:hypothetical protein